MSKRIPKIFGKSKELHNILQRIFLRIVAPTVPSRDLAPLDDNIIILSYRTSIIKTLCRAIVNSSLLYHAFNYNNIVNGMGV